MTAVSVSVEGLSVYVGPTRLLGPVSFAVAPGGTLVIMGETGAGKSLIAQAILGTLPAALRAEGQISVDGARVDTLSLDQRAALWGRIITTLPQEPWRALDPLMHAARQMAETHRHVAAKPARQARADTAADFATLGLQGAERRLPGALSGGMAQRVAFAAATAGRAPILLADEPTKGLDAARHAQVVRLLADLPAGGGTLIAITHDVAVARQLGGQAIVLRDGDVVEQGPVERVLRQPTHSYTSALLAADPQSWPSRPPATATGDATGDSVLTLQDISVSRGGRPLIDGLNLTLHAGERVALTGPSGMGKTTLLDVMAGLLRPAAGRVTRGADLAPHAIQKLYQDPPAAFPARVPLRLTLRDVATRHKADWAEVTGMLERLGIDPQMLERRPDAVSGGELQRISIARALTVRPRVLLADEPTSRLDPITQRDTLQMLDRIARDQQIAIVLVTHDPAIAAHWADRVIPLG